MKLGIVGVTGMVGRVMMDLLDKRNFPLNKLCISSSEKSVGKEFIFNRKKHKVISIEDLLLEKPNIVLFSAGSTISKKYAPEFEKIGSTVIDNSSAWRMDPTKKLVVPEINSFSLNEKDKIIANPNCSTIQLVMILYPLHIKYVVSRVIVSTYQSVTGTGKKALDQLNKEENNKNVKEKVYPHSIYKNVIPHCDSFSEDNYTLEEIKLMKETRKIMNDDKINITATAARVPVIGGHSESVNITFKNNPDINMIHKILSKTKGVVVLDEPKKNIYPMPILSQGKDEVFVGRIRKDYSHPKSINIWIVADNLRKGAATNAIQIAEYLTKNNYVN
ncbi:aspartate-semialdehyde dehydrogenase [Blattabacterium cuenoti]|nr:aspartate-semialdehyde dehydrogenase [Blattabacterium cuenoti]